MIQAEQLFIVSGVVSISQYEDEHEPERRPETRLVMAEDAREAVKKFTSHFDTMTSEYATYYSVCHVNAHKVIS